MTAQKQRQFGFDNSYARLPQRFYAGARPSHAPAPRLMAFNSALAADMGLALDHLSPEELSAIFSGNELPADAEPIALAYAGHQFGGFNPHMGDGRAILIGEVIAPDGRRLDLQLKGAGQTPFSRRGDGKAAIGPVLREFLVSEAMHALGIPTTRALAATLTGEPVYRETVLQGAVITRVAASHIRIGTFQYFAARQDQEALQLLTDYALSRHYPDRLTAENRPLALLEGVIERQAHLVSEWMRVGFVHGVMNTDNMSISGETIDYGPCAFLDAYDPAARFSSIDTGSRYAFANQGPVAEWNLARLAESLLPLLDANEDRAVELATTALKRFSPLFAENMLAIMRRKLGLSETEPGDAALVRDFLKALHQGRADYTLTFRALSDGVRGVDPAFDKAAGYGVDIAPFRAWLPAYRERLSREKSPAAHRADQMDQANPLYIPRNHLVEAALADAAEGDFHAYNQLRTVLKQPYVSQVGADAVSAVPPEASSPYRTFCGT